MSPGKLPATIGQRQVGRGGRTEVTAGVATQQVGAGYGGAGIEGLVRG